MENTEQGFVNPGMTENQRPSMVTVIAILSWIMCGITLITTLNAIFNPPSEEEIATAVEQMRQFKGDEAAEMTQAMYEKQGGTEQLMANGLNLVALLLTVLGVVMMWQLKRKGFFLYLAGELLPYAGFLIVGTDAFNMGASMSGMSAGAIAAIAIVLMLVFDAAFIIMYSVNLKHMKN